MDRRAVAVALVALVVLSGCSFFGGTGTETAPPDGPTETAPPDRSTPTPTESDTPTPSVTYPDGYAASGVTDPTAAARTYTRGVLATESYTVIYNATVVTSETTTGVGFVERVDLERERAHLVTNFSRRGSQSQFWANGTVHVRTVGPDGSTTYNTAERSLVPRQVSGREFVAPVLSNVTWGPATVERDGGTTRLTYESTGLESTRLLGDEVDRANVTSFSATLRVGEDGIVRHLTYEAVVERAGGTRTLSVEVRVTGIGETTVATPAWVQEARQAAG